jgi:hypothetical protein
VWRTTIITDSTPYVVTSFGKGRQDPAKHACTSGRRMRTYSDIASMAHNQVYKKARFSYIDCTHSEPFEQSVVITESDKSKILSYSPSYVLKQPDQVYLNSYRSWQLQLL